MWNTTIWFTVAITCNDLFPTTYDNNKYWFFYKWHGVVKTNKSTRIKNQMKPLPTSNALYRLFRIVPISRQYIVQPRHCCPAVCFHRNKCVYITFTYNYNLSRKYITTDVITVITEPLIVTLVTILPTRHFLLKQNFCDATKFLTFWIPEVNKNSISKEIENYFIIKCVNRTPGMNTRM